jgi:hypothetical protein
MAIDISVDAGSQDAAGDFWCIGIDRHFDFEADFGTGQAGKLINVNFYLWGDNPSQMLLAPAPTGGMPTGYNFIAPSSNISNVPLLVSGSPTWENFAVSVSYNTSGLADFRLAFMHTMDMRSWIDDTIQRDNNNRLWRSKWNDPTEFTITPKTIYDSFVGNQYYIGIRVSTYTISGETYTLDETVTHTEYRNDCYFWNPVSPTDPATEWPYSPVKKYTYTLSRNSIPVSTLSTTQDTHVKLRLEMWPEILIEGDCNIIGDLWEYHWVGLVELEGVNDQRYPDDLPVYFGFADGFWGQSQGTFPNYLKLGVDMIENQSGVQEVSPDIWEIEFDLKKEFIEPGKEYRLYLVVKNEYCFGYV